MGIDGTLLVLGASRDQIFMIDTARALGLRVVAIDMDPKSAGFAHADESAVVSTRDVPAILDLVDDLRMRGHRLRGVTTMGSDIPDVIAELCAAARDARPLPRDRADRHRQDPDEDPLPRARHPDPLVRGDRSLSSGCARSSPERGLPLVVKPIDRSGSRGVFLLEAGCDLEDLFARSLAFSRVGRCLVEEYLPGPQISTETILSTASG